MGAPHRLPPYLAPGEPRRLPLSPLGPRPRRRRCYGDGAQRQPLPGAPGKQERLPAAGKGREACPGGPYPEGKAASRESGRRTAGWLLRRPLSAACLRVRRCRGRGTSAGLALCKAHASDWKRGAGGQRCSGAGRRPGRPVELGWGGRASLLTR